MAECDPNEQKAKGFIEQAEKKQKTSSGFGGFLSGVFGGGSSSSRLEEAAELYVRAANAFKMAKKWKSAGDAFCRAAELHIKTGTKHEGGSNYVSAATCYKKSDPNEAVITMLKAIEIFTDMGRFSMAAKHHITIAEIYETELIDTDKAVSHYEQAADYYKSEESTSSTNKCLMKVAHYCALSEQYEKAIEIYDQIGTTAMNHTLLKYGAKDYFFKATLCSLCIDLLAGTEAMEKYEDMFPQFAEARECKLLKTLMEALKEEDVDTFTDAVKDYDSISRLDQWTTTMLLRVKKTMGEDDSAR
ncbi:alpha-soluble NSF attachment protein-like [Lineus longissimus]|uniref:alpha-soluble NSF attachment protein-like n=1 Tax=Lineus longissimus TaxID=88925 RepID=UPI002B4C3E01